jgi:hypothetical protein
MAAALVRLPDVTKLEGESESAVHNERAISTRLAAQRGGVREAAPAKTIKLKKLSLCRPAMRKICKVWWPNGPPQ